MMAEVPTGLAGVDSRRDGLAGEIAARAMLAEVVADLLRDA
jgi:hypothetical protein